jgi:hypothetical protein
VVTTRARGSVFGFDVYSTFAFEMLRAPAGLPRLDVVADDRVARRPEDALVAQVAEPGFLARIFGDGETYRLWVDRVGWFDVDPRVPRISAPPSADPLDREELVLGVPALLCFLHHGDASLHAAAIAIDGEAVLLVAPQARGKSTLAAAFAQRGYRVLSEDLACIRLGDRPYIIPGPPTVRLRNDVTRKFDMRFARMLRERSDRTRYVLADADSAPVPVRAIFLLRQSTGAIDVEPVDAMRSLPDLWHASFRLTRALERSCFESITALANAVPILELRRPLQLDALEATVETVVAAAASAATEPLAPVMS